MSDFEKWFKTTEAYKMMEEQNYFKMNLFFFVTARNQYSHSGVQVAYLTWQHQQAKIDQHQLEVHSLGEANLNQAMMLAKKQEEIDNLKSQLNNMEACYIQKKKEVEGLKAKHKTKNEKIMKLVSLFTSLSSQILCEEPELSDKFYQKFDEFHSVLINIEL